jgi:hypothetical protein
VIARRVAHLSGECKRVLVLASILGREFDPRVLAQVAGVTEDALLDTLDEAMEARVVSDVPGARERLRFAHVLIRDTLYEGLTTARRVRLHRQVVAALEQATAASDSNLAYQDRGQRLRQRASLREACSGTGAGAVRPRGGGAPLHHGALSPSSPPR